MGGVVSGVGGEGGAAAGRPVADGAAAAAGVPGARGGAGVEGEAGAAGGGVPVAVGVGAGGEVEAGGGLEPRELLVDLRVEGALAAGAAVGDDAEGAPAAVGEAQEGGAAGVAVAGVLAVAADEDLVAEELDDRGGGDPLGALGAVVGEAEADDGGLGADLQGVDLAAGQHGHDRDVEERLGEAAEGDVAAEAEAAVGVDLAVLDGDPAGGAAKVLAELQLGDAGAAVPGVDDELGVNEGAGAAALVDADDGRPGAGLAHLAAVDRGGGRRWGGAGEQEGDEQERGHAQSSGSLPSPHRSVPSGSSHWSSPVHGQ